MTKRRRQWPTTLASSIASILCMQWFLDLSTTVSAQPPTATNTTIISTCESGTNSVTFTVPATTNQDEVDVFFLFDDTGTFIAASTTVARTFETIINDLIRSYPSVSWGFGVGKFEDFGGPGRDYSGAEEADRPFILNQPIVDSETAGDQDELVTVIRNALNVRSPGNGGDLPESGIEALYQVAVGSGFDGNGDGILTGTDGSQVAGAGDTQASPDDSGDVPPFSSLDTSVLSSGTVGGAGFRTNALKLVIIATDICSASAFSNGTGIPGSVTSGFDSVPAADFSCAADVRFGVVGTAIVKADSTVPRSIVPLGGHTVDETVDALVSTGIQVIGLVTQSGAVEPGSGPTNIPAAYVTSLARLTGAVDSNGEPLVYEITPDDLDGMVTAITSAVTLSVSDPVNVTLVPDGGCDDIDGFSFTISPDPAANIQAGANVTFEVTVNIDPTVARGNCQLTFTNSNTGDVLSPTPVELSICEDMSASPSQSPTIAPTGTPPTEVPTQSPSATPTNIPSESPVVAPTSLPTALPTFRPSSVPTAVPSGSPTDPPTGTPSSLPTVSPTLTPGTPSEPPVIAPTGSPSGAPSVFPSPSPTSAPTAAPSPQPVTAPTASTAAPTVSVAPSATPSARPSLPRNNEPAPMTMMPSVMMTPRPIMSMLMTARPMMSMLMTGRPTTPRPMVMSKTSRPSMRPRSPRPTMGPSTPRPTIMPIPKSTANPTISAIPTNIPQPGGMGVISLFGRDNGVVFQPGQGIIYGDLRPADGMFSMPMMQMIPGMNGKGSFTIDDGSWGFDNIGVHQGKGAGPGLTANGPYWSKSAKGGFSRSGKGDIKGRGKGHSRMGGRFADRIFDRNQFPATQDQNNMARMGMKQMQARSQLPAVSTSIDEVNVLSEGSIIFLSDDGDLDNSELRTKFTGTLIGFRAAK